MAIEQDRNGQTVIDAFNYKNNHLLTYEESATGETKAIIDEYFDKRVFDELFAEVRFGHSDKLTLDEILHSIQMGY